MHGEDRPKCQAVPERRPVLAFMKEQRDRRAARRRPRVLANQKYLPIILKEWPEPNPKRDPLKKGVS